jgi:PHD/YefM family antitoxin component YafN of YafNO toxin-antitoxin module
VAYLRNHTDEVINAVSGTGEALFIGDSGAKKVVLENARSYEQLQQSLTLLRNMASRAECGDTQTYREILDVMEGTGANAMRAKRRGGKLVRLQGKHVCGIAGSLFGRLTW